MDTQPTAPETTSGEVNGAREGFFAKTMLMMGSLVVWGVHFLGVYIFNALACARGFATMQVLGFGIVPLTVTAFTVVALALIGLIMFVAWRRLGPAAGRHVTEPAGDFMRYITLTLGGLSLLAIVWDGLPALIVPPCA